jgi:uncharacterized protein
MEGIAVFHFQFMPALLSAAAAARPLLPSAAGKAQAPMIAASEAELELKPSPINPGWILAGQPVARLAEHSKGSDDAAATAIWDCTAGEFRWFFDWDETVMILEGGVTVTDKNGVARTLKAGDIAYFKGGTWATWRIDEYVRKIAFVRRPMPAAFVYVSRLKAMARQLRGKGGEPLRSAL